MNLQGAVNMILSPQDDEGENDESASDNDEDDEEEREEMLAVDIVDSTQLGTGARITCLTAWRQEAATPETTTKLESNKEEAKTRKNKRNTETATMDEAALKKARSLVNQAKKLKRKKANKV